MAHSASRSTALFLVIGLGIGGMPATAQAAPQDQDTVRLAPVEVSVLRTPTRLDRMPFSVSVLEGSALRGGNTGMFIDEALRGLAGVRIQNRFNGSQGERISIRGFGSRAQFGVRGIKIFVDGIPATLPDGQSTLDHLDLGSLGQVEALRGPAGALYGNGAGGVLLFRSTDRGRESQGEATVVTGSDGMGRLQGTVSGSVGDGRYFFSVAESMYDGFRDNTTDSGDNPYSTSEKTLLNGTVAVPVANGELRIRGTAMWLDALNAGSLPADLFEEGSNQAWGFNVRRGTRKDVQQAQLGAAWNGQLGDFRGEISTYGVTRSMDNPIPPAVIDLDRKAGGVRGALGRDWDLSSGMVRLDFGAELDIQSDDRLNFSNDNGQRGDLTLDQNENVRSVGTFAMASIPLSGKVTATTAARFDRVRFEATDNFISTDNPDDSGVSTMSAFSPSVGIHADLGDMGLYGSLARSFQTPTTTELGNQPSRAGGLNPDLDPQVGWTTEVGARGSVGSSFAYDVAAFRTALEDQLIPFEVPSAPGRSFFRNAGASTMKGVDAAVRVRLAPGLAVRGTYSYVDAKFTDFSVDGSVYDGNRVPGIAPHSFTAASTLERDRWFLTASTEVRGAVPVDDENSAEAEGFVLLDLKVGGRSLPLGTARLSPFAGIRNLTDTRYVTSVVVNAFGGRFFEPGPGRTFYVGMSAALGGN